MTMFHQKIIRSFIVTVLIAFAANSHFAAVLTVTTNADTDDSVCDSQCSLREAVSIAVSGDTIIFARELRGATIHLTRTLEINRRMLIDGPNKRRITITANGNFRVLRTTSIVSIDRLIITGGVESESEGGGIYNTGTLNMTNCAVINNQATNGGGIYSYYGTGFVNDSTIAGNTSTAEDSSGGMELFRSTARLINSTISGNVSQSTNGGAGGVRFFESGNWFVN